MWNFLLIINKAYWALLKKSTKTLRYSEVATIDCLKMENSVLVRGEMAETLYC